MAKTLANKKDVNNKAGYVVKPIAVKDIEKEADFGTFKITRTRECIAYTNYVGYSVIVKPWTTTAECVPTQVSLYEWLNIVLNYKDYLEANKDKPFEETEITCGEFLWTLETLTKANMETPCIAFASYDIAVSRTNEFLQKLKDLGVKLNEVMNTPPPEEDEKANAVEFGRAVGDEYIRNNITLDNTEGD